MFLLCLCLYVFFLFVYLMNSFFFFRMRNILALLCVFLMAAHQSTSLLTKGESIRNTIHNIVNIAQITLVHIKKLKLLASPIGVPPPSIVGLSNISHELGVLDNELQQHPFLIQIQADVSSLEGRVRSLALSMECPLKPKPAVQMDESVFPDSHLYMTVTKVQHYLEELLLNKGKLKLC
ncbi:leptin-B-like [Simochromis diagramma]|uniref:leptin-B-like n=1 Tax=Simochromis diagramma TaxID=43689 RepID=UPI001A7E8DBC|nr:leptin-B-like [Simochromis diagramma]